MTPAQSTTQEQAKTLTDELKQILMDFDKQMQEIKQEFISELKHIQMRERASREERSRQSEHADEDLEKSLESL